MQLADILAAEARLTRAISALSTIGLEPDALADLRRASRLMSEVRQFAAMAADTELTSRQLRGAERRLVQFITNPLL